jgi:uncharacterized lipoprotein YajG
MNRTTLLSSVIAIAAAGILLAGCADQNIDLGVDGAPPAVASSFKRSYPDAKIVGIRKKVYEAKGITKYNIEFKDGAGKIHDVNFDGNGIPIR